MKSNHHFVAGMLLIVIFIPIAIRPNIIGILGVIVGGCIALRSAK